MDRSHAEPERKPGEAIVRVRVAGVCDTDLQLARGYMRFRGIPGHEVVGDVVLSDDPSWTGARVVADINAGCGHCPDCIERDGHHCPSRTVLGIVGRDGAFAERFAIPERCLVRVPDGVDDERAVFAEPLAAALHVVDEVEARSAARAIVVGDGKLGQLVARAPAASSIDTAVIGHHEAKLALLRRAGLSAHLESAVPSSLAAADLVVEASGSESGLALALRLVRPRGTVVVKTTIASKLSIDLAPLVVNEVRLVGSRCGDIRGAIEFLEKRSVDTSALVDARYPLARADEALAHAGRRGAMKVLIEAR
jgi:threonine dehydrogenase-like Zn-dependent dehydrogenase